MIKLIIAMLLLFVFQHLNKNLKPDMSYLNNCCKKIIPFIRPQQLLIIESTVYPGATDEIFKSRIKKIWYRENFL